jgi:hypothetical protein
MPSHPLRPARLLTALALLTFLAASALPVLAGSTLPAQPAAALWRDVDERTFTPAGERWIIPQQYRVVELNVDALQAVLAAAPLEGTPAATESAVVLALPLPEGGYGRFRIVQSPVMAPGLAAKFPEISTYAGQGLDDPTATTRLDWTPAGFHAIIFGLNGTVYIDPFSRNDVTPYISYYARDFVPGPDKRFVETLPFDADSEAMQAELAELIASGALAPTGSELRTYRLAMAATGEYTIFHGGTVAAGMAAIVTTVNRVTGIYERDVAVRMVLVANNDLIVYTNPNTDPYTNNNGVTMLSQNQSNLDAVIGSANYDIGHVLSTGGGGVASLGVVCRAGVKARGVTGSSQPVGDPFDVDYVAHEIGHQFGANHTFNGNAGACSGSNRNGPTAYEPGSGSTIMAYAGICGAQNLQLNSDDYFHGVNLDEIVAYSTVGSGNGCPVVTPTRNQPPVVDAGLGGFTIPSQTPFILTGSASDPNGDALTYNWEEFDLGPAGAPNNPLSPPFFRSWPSVASPARTFPRLPDLVNNSTVIGEVLPNVTRALNFRLTVRDNRLGGGGVNSANLSFNVTTAAGPFQVTAPNTAVTWAGNSQQLVTWNVAGTAAAPVSCAKVDISLSADGGFTYPITLAAETDNDGAQTVVVPNIATTSARVRVACSSNIFFDISNVNFTITAVDCFWADINCSCGVSSTTIDVEDVIAVAEAWNLYQGSGLYTLAADIDCRASGGCDGVNDIVDVGVLASMWETACPAPGR